MQRTPPPPPPPPEGRMRKKEARVRDWKRKGLGTIRAADGRSFGTSGVRKPPMNGGQDPAKTGRSSGQTEWISHKPADQLHTDTRVKARSVKEQRMTDAMYSKPYRREQSRDRRQINNTQERTDTAVDNHKTTRQKQPAQTTDTHEEPTCMRSIHARATQAHRRNGPLGSPHASRS